MENKEQKPTNHIKTITYTDDEYMLIDHFIHLLNDKELTPTLAFKFTEELLKKYNEHPKTVKYELLREVEKWKKTYNY